jgi:hypothetical protein
MNHVDLFTLNNNRLIFECIFQLFKKSMEKTFVQVQYVRRFSCITSFGEQTIPVSRPGGENYYVKTTSYFATLAGPISGIFASDDAKCRRCQTEFMERTLRVMIDIGGT